MISISTDKGIAQVKLNRPEKRNALHPGMVEKINEAVLSISKDPEIKALILTGQGETFCAGADLSYLNSIQDLSSIENERDSEKLAEMFSSIYHLKIPTIAAVNGPAIAGGCGLIAVCDFVVAHSKLAFFAFTEVKIGFVPAVVSTFLIRKIGYGNAKKMLLSGERISVDDAKSLGLVDYLSEDVLADSLSLAENLMANSSTSYKLTKAMLNDVSEMSVEQAVNYCIRLNTISRSSEDFKQRIKSFLEKKDPK